MTDFEYDVLKQFIFTKIPEINVKLFCEIILVTISASYSRGTQSENSDVDFAAIARYEEGRGKNVCRVTEKLYLNGKIREVEIIIHNEGHVLNMLKILKEETTLFPTIKNRSPEEQEKWNLLCNKYKSWQRPDGWKECVEYFYFSKENLVFCNKSGEEVLERIQYLAKSINLLDYLYTRLYSNYVREIKNNDKVKIKKYIDSVYQGLLVNFILGYSQSEETYYQALVKTDKTVTEDVEIKMLKLLKEHRLGIEEISNIAEINKWIQDRIDRLDRFFKENVNI